MSKISVELPVKLEELCQFTFNFNNLIKIIDYLHQNNLSLQQEMKDIINNPEFIEIINKYLVKKGQKTMTAEEVLEYMKSVHQ